MKKTNVRFKAFFLLVSSFCIFGVTEESQAAEIVATTCEQINVQAAIDSASDGDTVNVPAGECEWTTVDNLVINKSITLRGNGKGSSIITTDGTKFRAVVSISATHVVVRDFTFSQKSTSIPYMIQASVSGINFRITGNEFLGTTGYAIDVRTAYGVIDNNEITFTGGSSQPFVVRGPSDSWETDSTMGGADNVFIENNVFSSTNRGYPVCSTNARCVFRYNVIGPTKIDMHGECTGDPGVRHYEIYNNLFEGDYDTNSPMMDIRGGTGRIFNNDAPNRTDVHSSLKLNEHSANHTYCAGYKPNCNCVYPAIRQIGQGKGSLAASEPLYLWGNTRRGAYWAAAIEMNVDLCNTAEQCGIGFTMSEILKSGRDFIDSQTKPEAMAEYSPYVCPHPLTGLSGTCDNSIAGIAGYNTEAVSKADVDNSGSITTIDALLTLRNSLGLSMTGTAWRVSSTTGDVNCDGDSNSTDALLILRYSLGLSMSETGWCE